MTFPGEADVDDFVNKVDEVSRLIDGLHNGTLSGEYVDGKIAQNEHKRVQHEEKKTKEEPALSPERREELMKKVEELQRNRERKEKARRRYEEYAEDNPSSHTTDYQKWDLWCPSDEEDDMFNNCTPQTPEFKAMEKDIDDRHHRMVKQRQIAERERARGNEAYRRGQISEAYGCYTLGLESQKQNIELQSNAAMASIKMGCYVQALEHCDKVLQIAEFLQNKPDHPLCVKALQRRAIARKALHQYKAAVQDLENAKQIAPANREVAKQLDNAKRDMEENKKQKRLRSQVDSETTDPKYNLTQLKRVEDIVKILADQGRPLNDSTNAPFGLGTSLLKMERDTRQTKHIKELNDLLAAEEACRVYLRECGGLEALGKRLKLSIDRTDPLQRHATLLLEAITTAATNYRNEEIITASDILPNAVKILHMQANVASGLYAAMLKLFQTLSCTKGGRARLASELSHCADRESGIARLLDNIDRFSSSQRASTLSVLTNCTVTKAAKVHLRASHAVVNKIASEVVRDFCGSNFLLTECSANLLSNVCGDDFIRAAILSHAQLVESLLFIFCRSRTSKEMPDSCLRACLTCLANGLVEERIQRAAIARGKKIIERLAHILERKDQDIVALAALSLSRIARQAETFKMMEEACTFSKMTSLLEIPYERQNGGGATKAMAIEDSVLRIAALFSGHGTEQLECLVKCGLVEASIKVLGAGSSAGAAGNAALLLSNVANHPQHINTCRSEKCMTSLIDVAKNIRGSAARNAGIALARFAQDPQCLEWIRKHRGIEIIYHNVKP